MCPFTSGRSSGKGSEPQTPVASASAPLRPGWLGWPRQRPWESEIRVTTRYASCADAGWNSRDEQASLLRAGAPDALQAKPAL